MGSLVLGGIGAGLGSMFGNPMMGLSLGLTVGGILFPQKQAAQERGKLDDLKVTGSGYGASLPRLYGVNRVGGNIIWSTDLEEHVAERRQGGKGGGGATIKDYTYTVSCAVAIGEGLIEHLRKIQCEDIVIYDEALIPPSKDTIRFYEGSESQLPDTLMTAILTADFCPAFRGTAYCVFEDLDLTRWGGRMPSFTFEIQSQVTGSITVEDVLTDVALDCGLTTDDFDFTQATDIVPGVLLAQREQGKGSVEDLCRDFSTDLAEINGLLVAVRRGTISPIVVDEGDLGAYLWSGDSSSAPPKLSMTRTQDLELPRQVDYTYISPGRNYEGMTQTAFAYAQLSVQDAVSIQVPFALDDDAAKQIAEKALWTQYLERDEYTTALGWKYLLCAPAGLLSVPVNGAAQQMRLQKLDIGLLAELRASLVLDNDLVIVQTVSGESVPTTGPAETAEVVPTTFVCWSGTELREEDGLDPGFYVAATGPDNWQGALIYYSLDGGSNYFFGGNIGARSEFGATTSTLANGVTADALDSINDVDVTLTLTGTLQSTSNAEAAATTTNAAVIGSEIVSYATATQTGALDYTLSNIYRGRRGSLMTGHTSSDLFVHVTTATVRVKVPETAIGVTVKVKCVSPGETLGDVTECNVLIPDNRVPFVRSDARKLAYPLFSDFTPTVIGADTFEMPILADADLIEIIFRCKTAGGSPAFSIEKSTVTGAFSATSIGSLTVGSGLYEASTTSSLGSVAEGDKIRVNVSALGTAADWTVIVITQATGT